MTQKNALLTVHKITIALSIAGASFFSVWAFSADQIAGGIAGAAVSAALVVYLVRFVKKTKNL